MDKIICLGKNYLDHAREMGEKLPPKPVIFLKPFSVLKSCPPSKQLQLPFPASPQQGPVHHEVEIVLRIKQDFYAGSQLAFYPPLHEFIDGITVGLDLTKRALQAELKKEGHPWTVAKVFPDAAIIGPWKTDFKTEGQGQCFEAALQQLPFRFALNGVIRQQGRMEEMIYSPYECLLHVATYFPLKKGDLLFTGTPAGVGEIIPGDLAEISWGDLSYQVQWTAGH